MEYLPSIIELVEFSRETASLEDIQDFLSNVSDKAGLPFYLYGIRLFTSRNNPKDIILTNYPEKWREHYDKQNYVTIDPSMTHCLNSTMPINWGNIIKNEYLSQDGKNVFLEAYDFGLRDGVSASTRTPDVFSMISFAGPSLPAQKLITGQMMAQVVLPFLHDSAKKIAHHKLHVSEVQLTPKQRECLAWVADGKSMDAISGIMGISSHTVNEHMRAARERLGAANAAHAVSTAISLGII